MLRIDKEIDVRGCEDVIRRVSISNHDSQRLRLATKAKPAQVPGGAVALAQAIVTWAQKQENPILWTYAEGSNSRATLLNLSRQLFGYAALACACQVHAADQITRIDAQALDMLAGTDENFSSDNINNAARGLAIFLMVRDDYPNTYPSSLYDKKKDVKNESELLELSGDILERVLPDSRKRRHLLNLHTINGLLSELFVNTHDHARKDVFGETIQRSIRGVYAAQHKLSPAKEASYVGEIPLFNDYIALLRSEYNKTELSFIEFSVFDSGPGLASRMSGQPVELMSIDDEYNVLCRCFFKHATSKQTLNRGMGLYRTLGMVKAQAGFIQIRSGRLALCKFFRPQDAKRPLVASDFALDDLYRRKGLSEMGTAAGTSATLILPVV